MRSIINKLRGQKNSLTDNDYKKGFVKNMGASLVLNVGSILMTYFTTMLITNITTKSEYGIYVAIVNYANMIAGLAPIGLQALAMREIAAYKVNGKYSLVRGIVKRGSLIIFIISVFLTIATAVLFYFIKPIKGLDEIWLLFLGLAAAPIVAQLNYFQGVLRALKHVTKSLITDKILRPIIIAVSVVAVWFITSESIAYDWKNNIQPITKEHLIFIFIGAIVLIIGIAFVLMKRGIRLEIPNVAPEMETKKWIKGSLIIFPLSALAMINDRIDIMMIGYMFEGDQIGIYNAAMKSSHSVMLGLFIVNYVLAPVAAELFFSNQIERLQNIVTQTARFTLLITLPVFIGLSIFGVELLELYGDGFSDGYEEMLVLLAGQFINILCGSVGYLLMMTKNEKYALYSVFLSMIFNLVFNYVLMGPLNMGIMGAAIASAVAMAVWNIVMFIFLKRVTTLNATAFKF